MNYWDQIRTYLQTKVSHESYDNWLKGAAFLGVHGDTLLVSVPDRETRVWLETEYAAIVKSSIRDLGLPLGQVSYEMQPERGARNWAPAASENGHDMDSPASILNSKFTFDSFVVGACNQFAHAAARSVAKNPSHSYNPLFV